MTKAGKVPTLQSARPLGAPFTQYVPFLLRERPANLYLIQKTIYYSQYGGKMGRLSYPIDEDNRRRLDLLTAFGIFEGHRPTKEELVNDSVRLYFIRAYERYRETAPKDDTLLRLMEELSG